MNKQIPPGQAAVLKAFRARFGAERETVTKAIALVCVDTGYSIPTTAAFLGKAKINGLIESHHDKGQYYYQLPQEKS